MYALVPDISNLTAALLLLQPLHIWEMPISITLLHWCLLKENRQESEMTATFSSQITDVFSYSKPIYHYLSSPHQMSLMELDWNNGEKIQVNRMTHKSMLQPVNVMP